MPSELNTIFNKVLRNTTWQPSSMKIKQEGQIVDKYKILFGLVSP